MPQIVIIAGPNGAGKTTASKKVLGMHLGIGQFVNADIIASGLAGFDPTSAAIEAGGIMLERLYRLADEHADFAFETTLASRTLRPWLAKLVADAGYSVALYYFWLPSADLSVERVATRVRRGGHHVPEETVRRRYDRGLRNFFSLYRPIATRWRFVDSSHPGGTRTIAEGRGTGQIIVRDEPIWSKIRAAYDETHEERRGN
ncbi:MAG TPA: AAA family ATPase [Tepidisphaeraceae bacterium]|jgi:predicted ABC-type ATPase